MSSLITTIRPTFVLGDQDDWTYLFFLVTDPDYSYETIRDSPVLSWAADGSTIDFIRVKTRTKYSRVEQGPPVPLLLIGTKLVSTGIPEVTEVGYNPDGLEEDTWVDHSFDYPLDPAGNPWTGTNVNDIQIRLVIFSPGTSSYGITEHYWAEASVELWGTPAAPAVKTTGVTTYQYGDLIPEDVSTKQLPEVAKKLWIRDRRMTKEISQ